MLALFVDFIVIVRRYLPVLALLALFLFLLLVLGSLSGCSLPPERLHYWSGHEDLAGPYGGW